MNKTNTKTYLFDFDGTLVDSMPTLIPRPNALRK